MESENTINIQRKKVSAFEKRIHEVDFIRGILIILVLIDHLFCFTNNYSASWPNAGWLHAVTSFYWQSTTRAIVREIALFGFCFTSGISCAFSKNNWKRAGILILVWALLCIVTNSLNTLINPTEAVSSLAITYNVIGVLASCILLYCFIQDKSWRMILCFALAAFLITYTFITPNVMNQTPLTKNQFLFILFEPKNQGDYLPLFPYSIAFFLGALFSYFFYKDKKSLLKKRYNFEKPICFVGRHTLLIYATHALVIIGGLHIIDLIIKGAN